MKVNKIKCNKILLLLVLLQCLCNQGAVITFGKLTPDDTNGYACAVIQCQHQLQPDDSSVLEVDVTSLGQSAQKLAMVFLESGREVLADDVSLANKSFTGRVASVELRLSGPEVCQEEEFVCEVTYVNQVAGETSVVAVVKPVAAASSLGCTESDRCNTLSRLTDYILSVNDTVNRLSRTWESTKLSESQVLSLEWKLVFRGTSSIRKSVYSAYVDGTGIPDVVEPGCKQVQFPLPCSSHYRNDQILNNWHGIAEVALAVYKDNARVAQVIFNAGGSTFLNWFDKARVKASTWTDMTPAADANVFSIPGYRSDPLQRVFFMSHAYHGCAGDAGWFVALDSENGSCDWDKNEAFPVFKYSGLAGSVVWDSNHVKRADFMAVFVRYFNVP